MKGKGERFPPSPVCIYFLLPFVLPAPEIMLAYGPPPCQGHRRGHGSQRAAPGLFTPSSAEFIFCSAPVYVLLAVAHFPCRRNQN